MQRKDEVMVVGFQNSGYFEHTASSKLTCGISVCDRVQEGAILTSLGS